MDTDTQSRRRGGGRVEGEAEIGETQPGAGEHQEPPLTGRANRQAWDRFPGSLQKEPTLPTPRLGLLDPRTTRE